MRARARRRGRVGDGTDAEPVALAGGPPGGGVGLEVPAPQGEPPGGLGPGEGVGVRAAARRALQRAARPGLPDAGLHPLHPARSPATSPASTPGRGGGAGRTRTSAGCTRSSAGRRDSRSRRQAADALPRRTGAVMSKESKVEHAKREGRHLRGTIAETLAADVTHFGGDDVTLLKFHGTYQQDDRDARRGRERGRGEGVLVHGAGGAAGGRARRRAVPRPRGGRRPATPTARSGSPPGRASSSTACSRATSRRRSPR